MPSPDDIKRADAALDRLYREIPDVSCKGRCQKSCGPVFMSRREWERIIERLGHMPKPTSAQAAVLTCPMLGQDGKCGVYDIRPVICRAWGSIPEMRCPHGCKPCRQVAVEDGHRWLERAHEISKRLYGEGY